MTAPKSMTKLMHDVSTHLKTGKYNIESRRLIPNVEWFDEQIARLTAWTQDPVGKEPPKKKNP